MAEHFRVSIYHPLWVRICDLRRFARDNRQQQFFNVYGAGPGGGLTLRSRRIVLQHKPQEVDAAGLVAGDCQPSIQAAGARCFELPPRGLRGESVDRRVDDARQAHRKKLDELLGSFDLSSLECEPHLVKGIPRSVLPAFAKSHDVDLTVMGTVCRTGMAGLFIGNTAEVVLQQVECSVLAVKPDGFRTPVTL